MTQVQDVYLFLAQQALMTRLFILSTLAQCDCHTELQHSLGFLSCFFIWGDKWLILILNASLFLLFPHPVSITKVFSSPSEIKLKIVLLDEAL